MGKQQNGTLLRRSGGWTGRYSLWQIDPHTKKKIRRQKAYVIGRTVDMTRSEARKSLRERIEQEVGIRLDSRVTLRWFIEQRWIPLHESNWRESTKGINLLFIRHINNEFGNTPVEDLDVVTFQRWLDKLAKQYSHSMVLHIRTILKAVCAELVEQDYVHKNPARLLRVPQNTKQVNRPYLSMEQIKKLIDHAGEHKTLLRLLFVTGLRPSELFALEFGDFDPKLKLLRITRSVYRGKIRDYTKTTDAESRKELQVVFLPDGLVKELETVKANADHASHAAQVDIARRMGGELPSHFIFPSSIGNAWWKENFQHRVLNPLRCKAFHTGKCYEKGIRCTSTDAPKVNFQVLRRTVATHAQSKGSPKDIAAVLRHSKPDTAALYYTQQQDASVRSTVEQLFADLEN